jgi:hypothetical protein
MALARTARSARPARSFRTPARRWLIALLSATALTATGCVTVDGKHARIPGVDGREAAQVLADFDTKNNEVYAKRDVQLNARIESGSFGAIDQASLRILRFTDPRQAKAIPQFTHGQPQFWIPRPMGWPKWFAVLNTPTYANSRPMLLVFTKATPDAPWLASWGPTLKGADPFPEPYKDTDGYVESIPLDEAGYTMAPKDVPAAFTGYLSDGKSALFEPGPSTSDLRKVREDPVQPGFIRQLADAPAPQYPSLAIRMKDGSAMVLFAATQSTKITVQPPTPLEFDASLQTFLTAKPKQSITEHRLAEYAAVVPRAGKGDVRVIASTSGVIGADGDA